MLIRGDRLTKPQQSLVLSVYCHRHLDTIVKTDQEWLAARAFHFLKDGKRLDRRYRYCEPAFMADIP